MTSYGIPSDADEKLSHVSMPGVQELFTLRLSLLKCRGFWALKREYFFMFCSWLGFADIIM